MWGNPHQKLFPFRYCGFCFRKVRCPEKTLGENTTQHKRQTSTQTNKTPPNDIKKPSDSIFIQLHYKRTASVHSDQIGDVCKSDVKWNNLVSSWHLLTVRPRMGRWTQRKALMVLALSEDQQRHSANFLFLCRSRSIHWWVQHLSNCF